MALFGSAAWWRNVMQNTRIVDDVRKSGIKRVQRNKKFSDLENKPPSFFFSPSTRPKAQVYLNMGRGGGENQGNLRGWSGVFFFTPICNRYVALWSGGRIYRGELLYLRIWHDHSAWPAHRFTLQRNSPLDNHYAPYVTPLIDGRRKIFPPKILWFELISGALKYLRHGAHNRTSLFYNDIGYVTETSSYYGKFSSWFDEYINWNTTHEESYYTGRRTVTHC